MAGVSLRFLQDEDLIGTIQILAWGWSVLRAPNEVRELSLTKYQSSETAVIASLANTGRVIRRAVFVSESTTSRLTMILKNVRVGHLAIGGVDGETRPTENFTLEFDEMEMRSEDLFEGHERGHASVIEHRRKAR